MIMCGRTLNQQLDRALIVKVRVHAGYKGLSGWDLVVITKGQARSLIAGAKLAKQPLPVPRWEEGTRGVLVLEPPQ